MSRYCWPILTPIPHCHTFTHPMTPKSTSHISDPPIFSTLVQKPGQKPPVQIISQLFAGVFVRGFCQGYFVWKVLFGVVFVCSPSVRIHLFQQKVKHHFEFHVSYVW